MPSDKGEIVLGVDLDGVCADFYSRMREIAADWFERELSDLTATPKYGLADKVRKFLTEMRPARTDRELIATEMTRTIRAWREPQAPSR